MQNPFNPAAAGQAVAGAALLLLFASGAAGQQPESSARSVPDTFTATTANMDPAGVALRINVLRWSADDDRAALLGVLTNPEHTVSANDELDALLELPTLGYVWPDGSPLGYSIKYARREAAPDGGERLTFVTGRRLGKFAREPWAPAGTPEGAVQPYTVIELRLDADGAGAGTMSPAAEVALDAASGTARLVDYEAAPTLLAAARRQPPPYWAR